MTAEIENATLKRERAALTDFARWHVARWMIHTALSIAPAGPARALLVDHLNAYGRTVLAALEAKP